MCEVLTLLPILLLPVKVFVFLSECQIKFEQRNNELEKEMKQERTKKEREFVDTVSCKEQTQ